MVKILSFALVKGDHRRHSGTIQGLIDLCNYLGNTEEMSMIEIGSAMGESAEIFAQYFKMIYCIDPFLNSEHEVLFSKRIERFDNVFTIRKWSKDAVVTFIDKDFHFIYIDGGHEYEDVIANIDEWLPKVKPGYFIGGHDFNDGHPGLIRAVIERLGIPDKLFKDSSWIKKIKE